MALNYDSDTNQVNITVPSPISVTVTEKGIKGDQGDQGIQGIQGIQGVQGDTGATGPSPSPYWFFDNQTTNPNFPRAFKRIGFDTSNIESATKVFINHYSLSEDNFSSWLSTWDDNINSSNEIGTLSLSDGTDTIVYKLSNLETQLGSSNTLTSVFDATFQGGSANSWVHGDSIYLSFSKIGKEGIDGQGVPTGGSEGQIIVKQSATDYDTAWDYVESVYLQVQNDEGSTLSAGTPVYAKGISGSSILVGKADANDSAKMPAIGVLLEETTDGSSGEIITAGLFNKTVSGLTGVSVGDTVFVSNTGTLTTTKPTASTDLLQNIGIVLQTNGSNIQKMKVSAIDRTNDIPNLDSGKFFVGGTTGQVSVYTLPTTDGTANQLLATDGSGAVTFVTPSTSNVTEGTNLYYTEARVAANSAVAANTAKISYPTADSTKVAFISVTQAVDLDTMESDIATNNAKVGYTDSAVDTRIAAASISDLSDVPTIGTAGQVLVVNSGATALEYANQTGGVTSVNTQTGAVVLDTDDISEGATNLYFTDAKADARIAAASIDDLSDVDTSTVAPTNGQALVWDSTANKWEPGTVSGGGSSPWTTSGSDIYYTTGNVGVGTTTPSQPLDVVGDVEITGDLKLTSGSASVVIGGAASAGAGSSSVVIGDDAGSGANVTYGVIIGRNAVSNVGVNGGSSSVTIGWRAGQFAGGSAGSNVFVGPQAGQRNTGSNSTVVGRSAGTNTTGSNNVTIGRDAGLGVSGTSTYENTVAVGYQALTALTTGAGNTAVGYQASDAMTVSAYTTALGYQALSSVNATDTAADGSTAVGYQALTALTTGGGNTAMGSESAKATTDGIRNTFLGFQTQRIRNASYNTGVGFKVMYDTSGNHNTAMGYNAFNAAGSKSHGVAIGSNAAASATNPTGVVAIGSSALTALTSGTGNTAVGYQAGAALTTHSDNTLVGYNAGKALTNVRNTVIGKDAFLVASAAYNNVVIGQDAGKNFTSVLQRNTLVGRAAGNGATNTQYSTLIGDTATVVSNASDVTALGVSAAGDEKSVALGGSAGAGENSVAIGYDAGNTTGSGNIFVGYQAGDDETGSNKLYIENSNSTNPLIYGEFDNDILRVNGTLQVNDPSSTGYAFPTATGTLGQVLEVDANGDLIFATPSGGGGGSSQWTTTGSDIYYNTGNVGIGTSNPSAKLDVEGNVRFLLGGQAPTYALNITGVGSNTHSISGGNSLTIGHAIINHAGSQNLATGGVNKYIGVGGSISGGSSSRLYVKGSTSDDTAKAFNVFDSSSAELFTVRNDGNVGIGNADPDATLDVDGDVDIELDSSTSETFTIHDGTHDLFQVDTGTTGTIFSVNDVSGLPKLTVDDSDGVTIDKFKEVKYEKPSNTDFSYQGDVVYFGATTGMTQGDLYYFNSSGNWAQADADAVSSSGSVLLAIALGTASDTNGMLLKGTFTMAAGAIDGTEATGDELYVSTTAGHVTSDVSAYTTGDVVRIIGYCLDGTNGQIWFNPSNDWIELS